MKNMTIENITRAAGGRYAGPAALLHEEITAVVTDSRKTVPGCMYAAIRGERVDGHKFIPQVMEKGALVVLAEQEPDETERLYGRPAAEPAVSEKNGAGTAASGPESADDHCVPTIIVASVLQAIKDIAEFYLRQINKPIVGIIGSVGKTSTKEMTAAVLSQKYRVLKTEGNFNNELGVPMTAFRFRDEDEIGVLEMGINHFGEMRRLAKIVRPDTVVMTNIGTAHLEFLKTRDGILRAKSEVFDYFSPDGHLVLNGDDDKLSTIEEKKGVKPVRFGIGEEGCSHRNDIWADEIEPKGLDGISCRIHMPEGTFSVLIPTPGKHMVMNALAGAAVGRIYGLTIPEIKAGIESYEPLAGRFHIVRTAKYTVIDDCYNANPASMKASLSVLKDAGGRRVAVLGDMGELGKDEKGLHAGVGTFAAEAGIDALYLAGPLTEYTAGAARAREAELLADRPAGTEEKPMDIRHFATLEELEQALPGLLIAGDTILVKASHFMHFEKITEMLSR